MFHMFEKINQGSPYLIAEMSANHAGKLDNALEIVFESHEVTGLTGAVSSQEMAVRTCT